MAGTDADPSARPEPPSAVESVLAETVPVSAVVMTGDLANEGRPEQYEAIAELPAIDRRSAIPAITTTEPRSARLFPVCRGSTPSMPVGRWSTRA
ncbi:MAG: hypothetical protein R2710_02920 [Acidimicrobiales bacterium]